jgi:hypothetical protein
MWSDAALLARSQLETPLEDLSSGEAARASNAEVCTGATSNVVADLSLRSLPSAPPLSCVMCFAAWPRRSDVVRCVAAPQRCGSLRGCAAAMWFAAWLRRSVAAVRGPLAH